MPKKDVYPSLSGQFEVRCGTCHMGLCQEVAVGVHGGGENHMACLYIPNRCPRCNERAVDPMREVPGLTWSGTKVEILENSS